MADVRRLPGGPSSSDVRTLPDLIQSGPDTWQRTAERLQLGVFRKVVYRRTTAWPTFAGMRPFPVPARTSCVSD